MGIFSSGSNTKTRALDRAQLQYKDYAQQDRNRFIDLLNDGQDAFETSARSAVEAALPGFRREIQGIQENAIRRGISTGDLGTSYEGDAASAFQSNVANAISGQAMNLYNTRLGASGQVASESGNNWLDLLSGNADRAAQAKQSQMGFWSSLANPLGYVLGNRGNK